MYYNSKDTRKHFAYHKIVIQITNWIEEQHWAVPTSHPFNIDVQMKTNDERREVKPDNFMEIPYRYLQKNLHIAINTPQWVALAIGIQELVVYASSMDK